MVAIVMNPTSGSGGSRSLLASISALLSGRSQYLRGSVSLEDASQRAKAELMAAFAAGRGGEAG